MALGHRALRGLALVQRRFQVEVAMMGKGTLQLGVLLPLGELPTRPLPTDLLPKSQILKLP